MSIATSAPDPRLQFDKSDRLAKALKIGNVSSNDMAEHLGVSRTTVSAYINGRSKPSRSQVRDWAFKTGVPFAWLETGELGGGGDDPQGSLRKITLWSFARASNDIAVDHPRWLPDRELAVA